MHNMSHFGPTTNRNADEDWPKPTFSLCGIQRPATTAGGVYTNMPNWKGNGWLGLSRPRLAYRTPQRASTRSNRQLIRRRGHANGRSTGGSKTTTSTGQRMCSNFTLPVSHWTGRPLPTLSPTPLWWQPSALEGRCCGGNGRARSQDPPPQVPPACHLLSRFAGLVRTILSYRRIRHGSSYPMTFLSSYPPW
jgi:hypothetical protein